MAWARSREPVLAKIRFTCVLTVASLTNSDRAISRLDWPGRRGDGGPVTATSANRATSRNRLVALAFDRERRGGAGGQRMRRPISLVE